MNTHLTQYALIYKGRIEPAVASNDKAVVERYISDAVAQTGNDPADYGIAHRAVTIGDWAPTTSHPGGCVRIDSSV